MRVSLLHALVLGCFAMGAPRAEAGQGHWPFCWPGCCRHDAQPVGTTNVSGTSKTPPVFASMTRGTKRLVTGTKNLFVAKTPPAKRQGVTATHRAARPPRPKQGFFKRLFNPQPPPAPKTVEEWMSLEQIHP